MAAAPQWKVYDASGKYQASCHEIEAAASLMGFYGNGATIRHGHRKWDIVWTEGEETCSGVESYDAVALAADERLAPQRKAMDYYREQHAASLVDAEHGRC